jgi:hypothetical protein
MVEAFLMIAALSATVFGLIVLSELFSKNCDYQVLLWSGLFFITFVIMSSLGFYNYTHDSNLINFNTCYYKYKFKDIGNGRLKIIRSKCNPRKASMFDYCIEDGISVVIMNDELFKYLSGIQNNINVTKRGEKKQWQK